MMRLRFSRTMCSLSWLILLAGAWALVSPPPAMAQPKFVITPVAEKKIAQLPSGPLYWRVESVASLAQARAAEGPVSLVADVACKVWLFTLGAKGGATPGTSKVAEIGPLPAVSAKQYLLRINQAGGPSGARTAVHTHPGSESFYILAGQLSQKMMGGVKHLDAGQSIAGSSPGHAMEVSSSGSTDLLALVMFVVDADTPFSSPAKF